MITPLESLAILFAEDESKALACEELPKMISRLKFAESKLQEKGVHPLKIEALKFISTLCSDALTACDCPKDATVSIKSFIEGKKAASGTEVQ